METSDIPIHFGPASKVLWETPIGEGQSSPVIWGKRIFLTTCSPKDRGELTTVCLDRSNGKVLWRKTVTARKKVRFFPGLSGPAAASPAADARQVYVYFGTYGMLCYDHEGTQVWKCPLDPPSSRYGPAVSPILHKNTVTLVLDGNKQESRMSRYHLRRNLSRDPRRPVGFFFFVVLIAILVGRSISSS